VPRQRRQQFVVLQTMQRNQAGPEWPVIENATDFLVVNNAEEGDSLSRTENKGMQAHAENEIALRNSSLQSRKAHRLRREVHPFGRRHQAANAIERRGIRALLVFAGLEGKKHVSNVVQLGENIQCARNLPFPKGLVHAESP
jgi:hypothetical protein